MWWAVVMVVAAGDRQSFSLTCIRIRVRTHASVIAVLRLSLSPPAVADD
jgi:K+/H+ antiporter YhaU regulatory subunit KhtT